MVDVILSKSANKQLYKNLAERLEQLKEYFVKFCGEQYRDKIEYFFEDCKFLIIDKTCPDVQKKLLYASPKEDDSSAYFNMSILQNASEFSKGGWQTQTEEIDKTLDEYENFVANGGNIRDNENENWPTPQIMQEIIFPTVRECKDLVKEAADRFYSSLFSMIKNNTDRDSPNHIYKYAFGYAIRPVFEKIAEIILTKNNYTVKDNFKYSIDNYVIPDMMKCCASFGLAKKDPNYVFNVASELFQYSTTGNFKDKTPEEYIVMAKEIRMVGNFLVNEIIDNITTSFEDASDLAFYDECEDMVDKAGNKDLMPYVEDFYNALNTAGQAVRTNKEDNKQRPFCLIKNNTPEKTIVHEATHGISWQGLRDKYGNGNPINEVVTEFIARGVCRLMRQDNFTLLENGKKEDSCGYSLALQYIKELTTKYKDIFIKAYLKDNNGYLFDGIGYENAGELNKLVRDVINGTGYYNENIQTQFEDLFDKIEKYRQAKAENENDM